MLFYQQYRDVTPRSGSFPYEKSLPAPMHGDEASRYPKPISEIFAGKLPRNMKLYQQWHRRCLLTVTRQMARRS